VESAAANDQRSQIGFASLGRIVSPWTPTINLTTILLILLIILQKYRITKRVGGGSFGDIYLGVGANGEKVGRESFVFAA
jgi:hypothetical protein